jgi:hypothetical protein
VQRQEVGGGEDVLRRLHPLRAELTEALFRDERVVGDDVHAQPERPPCDLLADPAEAEHPERLALELDPTVARALPAALLERRVRLRDVSRERDEQADRMLRSGDDRRLRRVRDDDAPPRRRLDVDVVDPDAGSSDHLQPFRPLEQVGRELRRGADHDPVVTADLVREVAVQLDVDVEALA